MGFNSEFKGLTTAL